jgi:MFS family permease
MPDVQTPQPVKEYAITGGHRTYIFVLLFLLYFFDVVDRYMVSSMFPFIQKEWGLTDMQSGMLVSTVYWSILVLVFPASIIIDRWSRRKTISIMAVCWSIASMACAFVGNFAQMFTARTILGIGESGYGAGGTAMITGLYPAEKRARMMGLWNASIPLATAVAIAVGGVIATHWGWRAAFGLTALPGLVVAILFFFIKDYKTVDLLKTVDAASGASQKIKLKAADVFKEFIHTPTLIFAYLGQGLVQFVAVSIITWLPTYLNRTTGIPIDQAGLKSGAVMLLAIIGAPLGGLLCDLWVKKKINSRLIFAAITTILTAAFCFAAFYLFKGDVQYIFLLLVGMSIIAFLPAAAATTQEVVHPGMRAVSSGLAIIFTSLFGSLGPVVIGSISDASGIETSMKVLPVFLVVAAAVMFTGSFFFMKDYNKVEKIPLELESR